MHFRLNGKEFNERHRFHPKSWTFFFPIFVSKFYRMTQSRRFPFQEDIDSSTIRLSAVRVQCFFGLFFFFIFLLEQLSGQCKFYIFSVVYVYFYICYGYNAMLHAQKFVEHYMFYECSKFFTHFSHSDGKYFLSKRITLKTQRS